jgi:hypothetical protein
MIILSAWWGMGYAALAVATVVYGWHVVRTDRAIRVAGQILATIGTLSLCIGLLGRAIRGHGWPFVSPADAAAGIALLMLLIYWVWDLFSPQDGTGFTVSVIGLVLLSYSLTQYPGAPLTERIASTGTLLGSSLNLLGGGLLALAAAISLAGMMRVLHVLRSPDQSESRGETRGEFRDRGSETLVRGALFCLAVSLAIDTWWLQKVGLGSRNDAQQAGIAIAWMIYFGALRLRTLPRWRGWPWAAILAVGFFCVLPILLNVPWLENTLRI